MKFWIYYIVMYIFIRTTHAKGLYFTVFIYLKNEQFLYILIKILFEIIVYVEQNLRYL